MIETLLKDVLPRAYGLGRKNVQLSIWQATNIFELGDQVACKQCHRSGNFQVRNNCNEHVMKIVAHNITITIVEHEDYIKQFNGTQFGKGGTCDYMMFDAENHKKIVFCDLGCYSEEYVVKKHMKSRRQVYNSLMRFMNQDCGRDFINQFGEIALIFGRRDPAVNPNIIPTISRGNVIGNMQAFLTNPFNKRKYAVSTEFIDGKEVCFIIINYPEPYIW